MVRMKKIEPTMKRMTEREREVHVEIGYTCIRERRE